MSVQSASQIIVTYSETQKYIFKAEKKTSHVQKFKTSINYYCLLHI